MRRSFQDTVEKYKEYLRIYTDRSKSDDAVGCAFYSTEGTGSQSLDDDASVFTAESRAICLALDLAGRSRRKKVLDVVRLSVSPDWTLKIFIVPIQDSPRSWTA